MTKFLIKPKPGHDESEVDRNPTRENAWIYEMEGGRVVEIYDATNTLVRSWNPVRPSEYLPRETFVTEVSEEEAWEPLPDGKLARGQKAYHQLIYKVVQDRGGASRENIIRALAHDYRVISLEEHYFDEVQRMIDEMRDRGLLVWKGDRGEYDVGTRMKYGSMVEFEHGYDPRAKKLVDFVDGKGGAFIHEAKSFLMSYLKWVEKDVVAEKLIESLKEQGILVEEPRGWLKAEGSLETF